MITIDGQPYNADLFRVSEFEESFEILSGSNSGRLQDGTMYIEPIGTFYNHELTFVRRASCSLAEWDNLYYVMSSPNNEHTVTVPHKQGTLTYQAYISSGKRKLVKIEGSNKYWDALTCRFTAMEPQRRP